jgi:2-aminoadipate transaminase
MAIGQWSSTSSGISRRAATVPEQPIAKLMTAALANPELISLAAGFVDDATLPVEAVGQALEQLRLRPESMRPSLQYGSTAGDPALREHLLGMTAGSATEQMSIDRIVVTAGSNQLLHLLAETLLDPGDIVLCAAPTYFVFLGALSDVGARAISVASDGEGMLASALQETLERLQAAGLRQRVKCVYTIPYFDNPAATTMSKPRREAIWEVVDRWSQDQVLYLISDDAYRALRYEGDDVPTFLELGADPERVIHCGTFSKQFAPGLRVGWGLLPEALVEPVLRQKAVIDFGSPYFNQVLVRTIIEQRLLEPQVERLRAGYRVKLNAMVDALQRDVAHIPGVRFHQPTGGLYVWLELPEHCSTGPDSPLWREATRRGVLYVPGEFCFAAEGEKLRPNTMRLSFGVQSAENIRKGISLLAAAIDEVTTAANHG